MTVQLGSFRLQEQEQEQQLGERRERTRTGRGRLRVALRKWADAWKSGRKRGPAADRPPLSGGILAPFC